ncbi:MAG: indole-3-glycerol phosphate synthase [Rhodothalassiaceae bacterium]|nr:MAG: indole-3-glycerol phosphate synthase [Rhodothalassiaceae bacterium]
MMADRLAEICARKREEVAAGRRRIPLATLEAEARAAGPCRGFRAALARRIAAGEAAVIAEFKRRSPSAGAIRPGAEPAAIARAYEAAGAAALSVLTDAPFFGGAPGDLKAARAATGLPVLRKDFLVDPWQIPESRAMGADAVLVIMAAVDDGLACELIAAARDHGMDVLVEVHDEAELTRAWRSTPRSISSASTTGTLSAWSWTSGRASALPPGFPKGSWASPSRG